MTPTEDHGLVSSRGEDGLASVARPDARDAKTSGALPTDARALVIALRETGEPLQLAAADRIERERAKYIRATLDHIAQRTRALRAERERDALLAFAKAHEAWEALLIWEGDWDSTKGGLPTFTQEIYEDFTQLQALRNAAMAKALPPQPRDQQVAGDRSRETPLTSEADEKR